MKRIMVSFFILFSIMGVCVLQGCGKKAAPQATCKTDLGAPTYPS